MPNDPKDDDEKDDNNSEEGSIKSTDSKLGLQFLKYDSDEENSPPIQSQTEEIEQKEESNIEEEKEHTIPTQKENNSDEEDENVNHNNLHCAYCGLSSEAHLAQCLECKKWFCNGKLDNFSPSHIIFHLTKSKHKEVYLSPSSQVGEITLQCYNCSCKNIFLLGFLES